MRPSVSPCRVLVCRIAALALPVSALLLVPVSALAGGVPGCTVEATSTSGGTVDLTATDVWHLRSSDHVTVTATAPSPQATVVVGASVLGYSVPIASGTSSGGETVAHGEYDVSAFAALGRVFVVTGSSSGDFGSCAGEVLVVIDDVDALTSPLTIGGAVAAVIGALGTLWAVRNPSSAGRRGVALVAIFIAVAGASVFSQQVWTGEGIPLEQSAFADSVRGPQDLAWDPLTLAYAAGVTLLVVIVMPFPSELFNRTLEENIDQVRAAVRKVPLLGRLVPESQRRGTGVLGVVAFVALSGLLYTLLDPALGANLRSLITFLGMVIALPLVVWLQYLPLRAAHRSASGDGGRLDAVLGTLLIAAACVLISRLTGFLPGYLYGLVFGYVFAAALAARDQGRALAAGATWMLGLAAVAWTLIGAWRAPGLDGTVPGAVGQSVLAALTVAGVEGIVFALVPLRFLPGEPVFRAGRLRWGLIYALGLLAFIVVILNPANGFVGVADQAGFVTAAVLFIGFGMASVAFWAFFRVRRPASVQPPPG